MKEGSTPGAALRRVMRDGVLLKSVATERELLETLARPRFEPLIAAGFREWAATVIAAAMPISITERIALCRDAKDDKFLELAICGHADMIVTGDRDLLTLSLFRQIPILTPAEFIRIAPA